MQTKYNIYIKNTLLILMLSALSITFFLTSCEKEEKESDKVVLNSFGPCPVVRGGELRFIGENLDKVTAIVLPPDITITDLKKTSTLIKITVPQNAEEGYVILKIPGGKITTKTMIGYSEPISISGFNPQSIKAGDELTITGDYLNLIHEVIFTDRVIAIDTSYFTNQNRYEIKLTVPDEAQTGKIAISDGADDPNIIYSDSALNVTLPAITTITPNPVKAGSNLTITGTDLDLVKSIKLGGNIKIGDTSFVSQDSASIVLTVPENTKDDVVTLYPASGVAVVSSSTLVMQMPTVSVTPTTLKNREDITVTGTNLDLIYKVLFEGNVEGTIKEGGTSVEILVTVPDAATSGTVKFVTKAEKEVSGPSITIIDPVFTSFAPDSAKPKSDITIDGTDLDVVVDVIFEGGISGTIVNQTAAQLTVTVPVGAKTGKITIKSINGTEVQSLSDITITANLPTMTGFDEAGGKPGQILTLKGSNLLLIKEMVFPDDITATAYGAKNDTMLEVYVPIDVTLGYGTIGIITYEGDEGVTPEVFFGGTDPVADPSKVINDFDESGHDLGWDNWGGTVELGSDAAEALSGKYMHGTATELTGWSWIWGCNHAELTKPSVTKADHVLKIDMKLTKPFGTTGVNFEFEIAGTRINVGGLGVTGAAETKPDWVTITYDLSSFAGLPDVIPGDGEWGLNFGWADGNVDISGLYMDNFRFETK